MKQELQKRVCDREGCNVEKTNDAEIFKMGGGPFGGWMEVSETGGGTALPDLQKKRNWDFCSIDCMIQNFASSQSTDPAPKKWEDYPAGTKASSVEGRCWIKLGNGSWVSGDGRISNVPDADAKNIEEPKCENS